MADGEQQSAAAAAAEQVKTIVEAAERSAVELEAAARSEADAIRAGAEQDVERSRAAVRAVAERAEELKRRLDEFGEAVLSAAGALRAELDRLAATAPDSEPPAPQVDEEVIAEAEAAAARAPDVTQGDEAAGLRALDDPGRAAADAADIAVSAPDTASGAAADAVDTPIGASADAPGERPDAAAAAPEGARLLALKMALDGSPREETARYLRENFELTDLDRLLDEVYARARR